MTVKSFRSTHMSLSQYIVGELLANNKNKRRDETMRAIRGNRLIDDKAITSLFYGDWRTGLSVHDAC